MALEQTVKDLQVQNAQFQQMFTSLVQGQEDLKKLINRKKKVVGLLNMGRRYKGGPKVVSRIELSEDSVKNEGSTKGDGEGSQREPEKGGDDQYDHSQYSDEDDKYKQLEDRLNAVENLKMSGLNFDDLSLVPGVVIPPKFKVPTFAKYDGISCPKLHLKSYVQKINPHTDDRKLWMHYFQESLSETQLEWYYQLENDRIRTWSDLADAFYRQYEYNAELTPTRMQLQSMSMGRDEKFKEYAQKWRDLAGRVQPPLSNRELVDMFMGTLTGPFFNHLIGNSSAGFTELILTGERIEAGIKSGKIQVESSSNAAKRSFGGKKEANAVYGQKSRAKTDRAQSVGAVVISNPTSAQPQRDNARSQNAPRRQFTKINMPLSQALQHMLKAELITLRDPPQNVNTSSPRYNPNAKCAYHSNSPGHSTDDCWALKNKIQDMIEAKQI